MKIATQDKVVHDDVLGIDRRVIAGAPIPPDLEEAYDKAGGKAEDAPPVESGTVIATETTVIHDDAIGIDRRVIEGAPVPPDLVEAYESSRSGGGSRQASGKTSEASSNRPRKRTDDD